MSANSGVHTERDDASLSGSDENSGVTTKSSAFVPPPPFPYEPNTNTDEWLLTYGDMVTLLLTLFVLLVLNASFDKGKYSQPGSGPAGIFAALSNLRIESPYADLQIASDDEGRQVSLNMPADQSLALLKDSDIELIERREAALEEIRKRLAQEKLDPFISARSEGDGIRLEVPNSILFMPGSVDLAGRAQSVIRALAPVLSKGNYIISVEGHTDSSKIETVDFPSNWELSANRAARVVRLLEAEGIEPHRMEAVGYADTRPLAQGDTESARTENRRVSIFLRVNVKPPTLPPPHP